MMWLLTIQHGGNWKVKIKLALTRSGDHSIPLDSYTYVIVLVGEKCNTAQILNEWSQGVLKSWVNFL